MEHKGKIGKWVWRYYNFTHLIGGVKSGKISDSLSPSIKIIPEGTLNNYHHKLISCTKFNGSFSEINDFTNKSSN